MKEGRCLRCCFEAGLLLLHQNLTGRLHLRRVFA